MDELKSCPMKTSEIIEVLRLCAKEEGCTGCPREGQHGAGADCLRSTMKTAADRLEELNRRAAPADPQESEALDILESMLDVCDLDNPGPMFAGQHVRGGICKIMDNDAAKLRKYIADRRTVPENKPLTNADRICSMSNEELAVTLMCPNEMGMAEIECDHSDNKNCCRCLLDWLNQPESQCARKPEGSR